MERRKKIALELSDLVIYCRPVPFDEESKKVIHSANVQFVKSLIHIHRRRAVMYYTSVI